MAYSYEDIQNALSKQINYEEITSLLELDLNTIAEEVIEDPTKQIQFKVFFDAGEFNTTIEQQAIEESNGMLTTPILLKFINGDYGTLKGPKFFSTVFSIEVLGFEKDRPFLRKIFETYSYMNQGLIESSDGIHMTKTLEFPYFGEQFPLKGADRLQGFMRLFINYIYDGQMSNSVGMWIDEDPIDVVSLNIHRQKIPSPDQMNDISEITNIYESQVITFSGSMPYDGSDAAKKLLRGIKTLNSGLNTTFELKIEFNNVLDEFDNPDIDEYTVMLDNGMINIDEGGVVFLNFVFALAEV